jgi:phosphoribosylamine--glycine ligase
VVATSAGYPGQYEKDFEIIGLDQLNDDILVFHNGTKYIDNKLVTNGGRVISVTSLGNTMEDARRKIYEDLGKIDFKGIYYRKDIGKF